MHCLSFRWTEVHRATPAKDASQNLLHSNITYSNGNIVMHFHRARTTNDAQDAQFTDTDCYYFFFPVGGGDFVGGRIRYHGDTPKMSQKPICIKTQKCVVAPPVGKHFVRKKKV